MTDTDEIVFAPGLSLDKGKYPGLEPRTEVGDGMIREYDVAVAMRDGVTIYADVYRPDAAGPHPVLVAWAPYGKHGRIKYKYFPGCGVCDNELSRFAIFEAADPVYWCARGYALVTADPRGAWCSASPAGGG